jgi:N-acetylneuraminic acid mutarotase
MSDVIGDDSIIFYIFDKKFEDYFYLNFFVVFIIYSTYIANNNFLDGFSGHDNGQERKGHSYDGRFAFSHEV